ncbi:Transcription factor TRY-like protein [Drosera capensis]
MDIDGGDEGEGDEEENEAGDRFGRELNREGRDEEDGGEEVEAGVYVLRLLESEGRAVAADLACTGELHHCDETDNIVMIVIMVMIVVMKMESMKVQQKLEDAQGTAYQRKELVFEEGNYPCACSRFQRISILSISRAFINRRKSPGCTTYGDFPSHRSSKMKFFIVRQNVEVSSIEWEAISMTEQEEDLIYRMYGLVGDRWDLIAGRVAGRKPEEIERFWIMQQRAGFVTRRKVDL